MLLTRNLTPSFVKRTMHQANRKYNHIKKDLYWNKVYRNYIEQIAHRIAKAQKKPHKDKKSYTYVEQASAQFQLEYICQICAIGKASKCRLPLKHQFENLFPTRFARNQVKQLEHKNQRLRRNSKKWNEYVIYMIKNYNTTSASVGYSSRTTPNYHNKAHLKHIYNYAYSIHNDAVTLYLHQMLHSYSTKSGRKCINRDMNIINHIMNQNRNSVLYTCFEPNHKLQFNDYLKKLGITRQEKIGWVEKHNQKSYLLTPLTLSKVSQLLVKDSVNVVA